jgi:glycosyltransferase involved in cell wall biosynthesis
MRIAVFIKATTFNKGFGGLETQNKTLCEGLAKRGHNITVFAPKRDFEGLEATEKGIRYVFVPSVYRTLFADVDENNWYKRSLKEFKKYHEAQKFDLVISQSSAGFEIIKRKTDLGVRILSIVHGSILSELKTRYQNTTSLNGKLKLIPDTGFGLYNFFFRQRAFIHGSDKLVAVSNYVKTALMEETYVAEDKFKVIHNGIDSQLFNGIGIGGRSGKKLLYTGQIIKEKGVDTLLDIFLDEKFKDFTIDMVGGGPYLEEFRTKVVANKLQDQMILHGRLPYDALASFYAGNSGVFVFPTRRIEGFPMVLPEAMLAGLPVVAFDMGGVADAVKNGDTGFLLKSGNIKGFKDALLQLADNADLRKKLGENAKMIALKDFTVDAMLDQYEQVFREVGR